MRPRSGSSSMVPPKNPHFPMFDDMSYCSIAALDTEELDYGIESIPKSILSIKSLGTEKALRQLSSCSKNV